jgi:hypothetical protein
MRVAGVGPVAPSVSHRIQDLMALCPDVGSFGGGSTPPPGAFQGPPPEAVGPPTGAAAVFSAVVTITIGTGLAAGAAALAGLLGVATRSDVHADRPT